MVVMVRLSGLKPNAEHGFNSHKKADANSKVNTSFAVAGMCRGVTKVLARRGGLPNMPSHLPPLNR